MKSMKTVTTVALAFAMATVLFGCGGNTDSTASSPASSEATSSAAAKNAGWQAPSESYIPSKVVIKADDGSTTTISSDCDDHGRLMTRSWDTVTSTSDSEEIETVSDWDEYGHTAKTVSRTGEGDGESLETTTEVTAREVNDDGSIISETSVYTSENESFEDGEVASAKVTSAYEYGDDVQVLRKVETKTERFDKSGELLISETQTLEFDNDGLQTRNAYRVVDANGDEYNSTVDITWERGEDGRPISYTMVLNQDGADAMTETGEVKTDESGLISWVGNIEVDGEALSTEITIDHVKISDPLPNAYEGWKSFALTDVLLKSE